MAFEEHVPTVKDPWFGENYKLEDICNMDKLGLFFKFLFYKGFLENTKHKNKKHKHTKKRLSASLKRKQFV